MKWALGAMGAAIGLLTVLWVNGLARDIDLVRTEYTKLYAEFGTVRNEQMQRTGRLSSLETRLEVALPNIEARLGRLENASQ